MDVVREFIENIILESIQSAPIRKVVHALTPIIKTYRGNGTDVFCEHSPHSDDVISVYVTGNGLSQKKIKQLKANITSAIEHLGWYVGYSELDSGPYGSELTGELTLMPRLSKQAHVTGKLYHVTPIRNVKSITRSGLEPRGPRKIGDYARRGYSPRIYLSTSLETARTLMGDFRDADYKDCVILEIDPRKVSKKVVFRKDPETENSVWTDSPIPPDAIRLVSDEDNYSY